MNSTKTFLDCFKVRIGGIEICIWISCECKYKYSCNRISTRKLIVKYYFRERVFVEFNIISAGIVFRCLSRHISFGTKTSKGKNYGLFSQNIAFDLNFLKAYKLGSCNLLITFSKIVLIY